MCVCGGDTYEGRRARREEEEAGAPHSHACPAFLAWSHLQEAVIRANSEGSTAARHNPRGVDQCLPTANLMPSSPPTPLHPTDCATDPRCPITLSYNSAQRTQCESFPLCAVSGRNLRDMEMGSELVSWARGP